MTKEESDLISKINKLTEDNKTLITRIDEYEKSKTFTSNEWYRYWRNSLKEQSTTSSGVFFIFSAAILGYSMNNHTLKGEDEIIFTELTTSEELAIFFILLSILCYGLLSISRFFDYRKKAEGFLENKSFEVVIGNTNWIKNCSLTFFLSQIGLFGIGFGFQIIFTYHKFHELVHK